MKRRSILVGALALVLAAATVAAHATWVSSAVGAAAAAADDLAGNQPSGVVTTDDVAVSWTASTFNDGTPATGYMVRRYSTAGGTLQTVGADCAGTVTGTSCTEQNVPVGSWQYTVTPSYATWTGTESTKSDPVVVVAAVLDNTAPTTTATPSAAANGAGWHTADVTITLTATDPTPGVVKQITHSATGGNPIATTTTPGSSVNVPVTGNGTTTLSFFAEDVAGNVETAKTFVVKLDKAGPTATLASPSTARIKNGHSLTGTYADATSGVASVAYSYCTTATATCTAANGTSIGSSSTSPYSVTWNSQPADGDYKVVATATDVAGNSTLTNTVTMTVDNTAPAPTITSPANGATNVSHGQVTISGTGGRAPGDSSTVTVVVTVDNVAGAPVTASINSGTGAWSISTGIGNDKSVSVTVTQTDSAGNSGSSTISFAT